MNRYWRKHCMVSTLARFESSGFLLVGTSESPCICSSCWQRRDTLPSQCGCLSDYLQLPWKLWTVAAVHDEMCSGMHWNLINILSTCYKCTLSAVTHKFNVSGHMLMCTMFLVLVCGTLAQSLFTPFSYALYIDKYCNSYSKIPVPSCTKDACIKANNSQYNLVNTQRWWGIRPKHIFFR
jgi:hypothetical protein